MAAIGKGAAPEGLKRLARKSLKGVLRDLERARGGGESEIHDVRKGLKLVRSLLRMVKPAIGKAAFQRDDRALRGVHHLLAEARQRSAMLEALEKLEAFRKERKLRGDLRQVRKALRAMGAKALPPVDLGKLLETARAEIRSVSEAVSRWDLPRRDITPFVRGMRACYATARKALKQGLASADMAELHEARKSLIHFRHQLETVAPLWPSVLKAWAQDLQGLRELLGDLGDLDALEAVLASPAAAGLSEPDRRTAVELASQRRAELIKSIKPLSARLFAEKPAVLGKRLEALWTAGLRKDFKAKATAAEPRMSARADRLAVRRAQPSPVRKTGA